METETVVFITTEFGDALGLSFAEVSLEAPSTVESLTLQRTPKFEFILAEYERGVMVSFDRQDEDVDELDKDDLLEAVEYQEAAKRVRLKTSLTEYDLDVRKVALPELVQMRRVLHKMNFDKKFKTIGI